MLNLTRYLENKRKLLKLMNQVNKKKRNLEIFLDYYNQEAGSLAELLKETESFQEETISKLENLLKGEKK